LQAIENVLQKEVILFHRAYRQNRNHSVPRDLGGGIHYNILLTHVRFCDPEKNVGNRWQLWRLGLFVSQVVFGLRPILFGRSDGTTPLKPMQISKASDIRLVGTDLGGNFP
jgi:hypothetical protein